MKNTLYFLLFILLSTYCSAQNRTVEIINLQCENKLQPLGIDIENPRFSWNMIANYRGAKQSAYQILIASSIKNIDENIGNIWDSKKIESDKSIQIYYQGKRLESNKKYFWKVIIWDKQAQQHESKISFWTSGFLSKSDWKAKWIGLDEAVDNDKPSAAKRILSARMLRHEFNSEKEIKSATAFISGLGLFELYLNGNKIGNQVLAPALSEYDKTSFYMTFDVKEALQTGQNAIGVILGNGRYFAPRSNIPTKTRDYGFPKVICQIELEFEDGSTKTIVSDTSWKLTTKGPIRKNNEYDGEFYDARMELIDWSTPNFDDTNWMNAKLVDKPGRELLSQPNESIKIMEELSPISVKEIKSGTYIFDMGQNMVGWVELFVKGKKGDAVVMRFAEKLNDDSSLFLDNIRSAEVTNTYILKGSEQEQWEPRFTYHGFRYVEITGFPGVPDLSSIKGKVVYDAIQNTGSFSCSNELINHIYKNAYWGIRGNYRSIPTDCPQRDERHGWLGDRSAECIGESYLFNIQNLYSKWMDDIKDTQRESGSIADLAPSYWPLYNDNTTWPGTYLFASDMLYTQYGDLKAIRTHYPYMQKWISYMKKYMVDGIMTKDTYGDWCAPPVDLSLIHVADPLRTTNSEFIATAYFYTELKLMSKFAQLLGKTNDAVKYLNEAKQMKLAFNERFLDKDNIQYSNNSHTSNILALAFELVPPEYEKEIINNLLQKTLGESAGHIGNGIVGGQWLMRLLTNTGHADVAYQLATQTTYPSWGYMIEKGATTIWELWNGDTSDPGMNSGNHVMLLGDLIIWFYEGLAGIKADAQNPAFKHIIMKPKIVGDLNHVNASYASVYGEIKSNWDLTENAFNWKISIPANTTATIYVPTLNRENVTEGNSLAAKAEGVSFIRWENNTAVFEIESGTYSFESEGTQYNLTKGYTASPLISPGDTILFSNQKLEVSINCPDKDAVIHYTTDGSKPDQQSPIYTKPLVFNKLTLIKAQAYKNELNPSMPAVSIYDFIDEKQNGILWKLYKGAFIKLPNLDSLEADNTGYAYQFSLANIKTPDHYFAIRFKSNIKIEQPGKYNFYTSSNDGSKLYIDGQLIVNNDGLHATVQQSGEVELDAGMHTIRLDYFQSGGNKVLMTFYRSNSIEYQTVPGSMLYKNR